MTATDAGGGAVRDLLWASELVAAAEVDAAGAIVAANPALTRWAGRDLAGEPVAGLVAEPQRPALRAALDAAGGSWRSLTLGLLDGRPGAAEDHRVHIARAAGGVVLVAAEPAHLEREALVEQVLSLNDDLIATQRTLQRRHRELERARAEAQAAAERVRALESIVLAGLGSADLDELLASLLEIAGRVVGAGEGTVLLRAEEGGPLRTVAGADPDDRSAALADEVAQAGRAQAGVAGDASVAAVPLVLEGEVTGVLVVRAAERERFEPGDLSLLVRVGDRVSLALGHARLRDRERRIGETLQQQLLPQGLPDVEGVELCARYLPRARSVHVGGDFYDVVALPDGAAVLAIGDVAGKGLRAASVMGQVRSALHAYAIVDPAPAWVLERLDRFVSSIGGMTTALCVLLAPDRRCAVMATAGHLPPVLATAGGVGWLEAPVSPPLGLDHGPRAPATTVLAPGDRLVLCTDGLVELRGTALDDRLERLRDVVGRGPAAMDALCEHVLDGMSGAGAREFDDDVALLAVRIGP
ncbi:MAG TPA: SpoIIE family protein phosphatase [Baekduia sp.]|nr:SpoIIE family protein phosphatase [Baekduia sp.]